MLFETVNQNSKDKSPVPNMAAFVLQAILSGARYPASLYTNILIRIRAEQGKVTWEKPNHQGIFDTKYELERRREIYGTE